MTAPMTMRRFLWLLRTRGPVLSSWPDDVLDGAIALLRADPAAQQALAGVLAAEDMPPADCAGLARMQSVVRRALAPAPPVLRGARWAMLAACIMAGLYLGLAPIADTLADLGPTFQAAYPQTVLAALDQ